MGQYWLIRQDKRIKQLITKARNSGWEVTVTNKGHVRFKAPDGTTIISGSAKGKALDSHVAKTTKRLRDKGLDV